MSSKRLASTLSLHLERACCSSSSSRPALRSCRRHHVSTTRRYGAPHTRPLSTRPALQSTTTTTTTNTSSQDPNKAAAAEGTGTPQPAPSKIYTYEDILKHTEAPDPHRILIDVREPSELSTTGTIPTALNIPLTTSPDAFFLPETEFQDRFGFPRPGIDVEVVFYCKSGVRSRAAARMAGQAGFGGKQGEFPGSWLEWAERGGRVERG